MQRLLRAPVVKKTKPPRVKKEPKPKKEKVPKQPKVKKEKVKKDKDKKEVEGKGNNNDEEETDSICLSMDTESVQTDEDNESEGCTTVSTTCSEGFSPTPTELPQHFDRENKWNLTLISQLQNCNEIWQQKHIKKQKAGVKGKRTTPKSRIRPFSPCSDSNSVTSEMLSPLDALLIAADTSFSSLKSAGKSPNRVKEQGPYSPSILRRRQVKKNKKAASPYSTEKSEKISSLRVANELKSLSAAPTSGLTSLRGEEFCMSPSDVKKSEALLLSPFGYQNYSSGQESPTKRRKFTETSFSKNKIENISSHSEATVKARSAEEDIIALSLLHMKTAHTLVSDF